MVIVILQVAIALEQLDHGEIGRRLTVGHRGALEHAPALGVVRVRKFIDQARFPHPGLAHECYHLAMPGSGLFQGLV